MNSLFHFRLHHPEHETLNLVVLFFRSKVPVYYAVQEYGRKSGENHIHMIFETLGKSTLLQQFHKHFKDIFKGNQSFSCKELKKELLNNYIYMSKGTRDKPPNVLFHNDEKGVTLDLIEIYHTKYWSDKPVEQDKTITIKKDNKLTWSQQLTSFIKEKSGARVWQYDRVDIEILTSYVLKSLGAQSKKLSSFIIRDLVLGQLNALNPSCPSLTNKLLHEAFPDLSY